LGTAAPEAASPGVDASAAARPGGEPRPGPVAVWWSAIRPKTLSAGAVPVAVGSAVAAAEGGFSAGPAAAALVGALALQVGCNLANDVSDFRKGADTEARLGPARATQRGWLSEGQVVRGAGLAFAVATLSGVYLTAVAGLTVVLIGLCSIAAAVLYTGGPRPLGYLGLGDAMVFVFFGPVAVAGTMMVQCGSMSAAAWIASVSVGSLAVAILVVNNLRDRTTDALAGKNTLAVRFGARFARLEYAAAVALGLSVVPAAVALGRAPAEALVALVVAPEAARRVLAVWRTDGAALNGELALAARLGVAHAALLCAGWLW
jgi:1,4-dihydroxy-2-naphthoate octaprenyltransferase